MTLEDFYLVLFIVGFVFSLLSFFGGVLHVPMPHNWSHSLHFDTHAHIHGPAHVGDASHGSSDSLHVSPFNIATIMAFFALFGGTGYLLTHYSGWWFPVILGVALVAGLVGGSVVFRFLAEFLMAHDHTMKPIDYRMTGVMGLVSSSIREGGTGEITYSQGGARKCAGARSEDGLAISKGEEVVVTRYEKGIAYVCPWKAMAGYSEHEPDGDENGKIGGGTSEKIGDTGL